MEPHDPNNERSKVILDLIDEIDKACAGHDAMHAFDATLNILNNALTTIKNDNTNLHQRCCIVVNRTMMRQMMGDEHFEKLMTSMEQVVEELNIDQAMHEAESASIN